MQIAQRIRLLAGPYDQYERHLVVSRLLRETLGRSHDRRRVLDVGGHSALLEQFTDHRVTSINTDGSGDVHGSGAALPFPDASFTACVSMDTLEHVPKKNRLLFLRECLRTARGCAIVAAPLGSQGHRECEQALNDLHRSTYGEPHPYLSEHLLYGLPELDELDEYVRSLGAGSSRLAFAGDYVWQAKAFERTIRARSGSKWVLRLRRLLAVASSAAVRASTD